MKDFEVYCNLYKDAFGIKPRGAAADLEAMSDRAFQEECARLSEYSEWRDQNEKAASEERLQELVSRLKSNASEFGVSVETALRWDMDAEESSDDMDFYLYRQGVMHITEGTLYGMLEG